MIFRPVRPQSPCGPPTTNRPVGLTWNVTSPSANPAGRSGLMIVSTMNSRIVRPREIRATNTPTKGAQAIHQTEPLGLLPGIDPAVRQRLNLGGVHVAPGRDVIPVTEASRQTEDLVSAWQRRVFQQLIDMAKAILIQYGLKCGLGHLLKDKILIE